MRVRTLALVLAAAALLAVLLLGFWPHHVRGVVVDAAGPVAGATVQLRATTVSTVTDAEGRFVLPARGYAPHRIVAAWKAGYYVAGVDLSVAEPFGRLALLTEATRGVTLTLAPYSQDDDPTYAWLTSHADPLVAGGCAHCHPNYDEWRRDAHASSAVNPVFLSVYNGAGADGQAGVAPGFRLDAPADAGNCAACHVPAVALAHPEDPDPNRATGVAAEGVFCDFCHKIGDVSLDAATGLPHQSAAGVASYKLHRPAAGTQIFLGPLTDTTSGTASNLALERKSAFCAPCHSGGWWGVSAYASYDEWLASPYATAGIECQDCHMQAEPEVLRVTPACAPEKSESALADVACRLKGCTECHFRPGADTPETSLAATTLIGDRPAGSVHSHLMAGSRDEAFLRTAVAMTVTATQGPDGVRVDVAITNTGTGHHVPSDSPMRNLVLLVVARGAAGNTLPYLGQQVTPAWAGEGPVAAGNYAGLPGKGFAKVLEDWEGNAPAPQWRNGIHVLYDNRIAAGATDRSVYPFALPSGGEMASVEVRLLFRRAFKPWIDVKGWGLPDLTMAEAAVAATPAAAPVLIDLPDPVDPGYFRPARATTTLAAPVSSVAFPRPASCVACHAVPTAGWTGSGHAEAAASPLYRAWYKAAGQDSQGRMGRFCAGCHAPIGLLSGQIRSRWAWAGIEHYPLDDAAREGVTCAVCHGITETAETGDGGYVINPARSAPSAGAADVHAGFTSGLGAATAQSRFCAACHEATNPATGLPVMTTFSEWQAWASSLAEGRAPACQDCHFAAGRHGQLTPADLAGAAQVAVLPATFTPGQELALAVRVSNIGAGHALPTGVAELRQVWLALEVTDASGRTVFRSGETDQYGDPLPGAVTYGVQWRDGAGNPTDRLWDAVEVLRDQRIPAGGSVVETYRFSVPKDSAGPLQVRAALNYRRVSGYLSSLMTIYLGEAVSSASIVTLAVGEASLSAVGR